MGLPFDRRQPGAWISGGVHAALLAAAIFGLSTAKLPDADEGIPVEVMTDSQFSEMTKGERQADRVQPDPKPRADRVADTRVERDPGEAKRDTPAPPKRPAEMKVAEEETEAPSPPPAPQRTAEAKVETPPPVPSPPVRPEPPKADEKAEAAKAAADQKAAAAKAAAAASLAEAKAEEADRQAEEKEAEALEKARAEAAKAKAQADAKAKADAEHRKELADAKAKADSDAKAKAVADAKAKADAEAKQEAKAELDAKLKAVAAAEAKAKAEADVKAKAVADAKAKAESDAKAKAVAQAKAKADAEAKAKKLAEAADKFSPGDIRQLLASKEASQSTGSTGREVQRTASLGTATGTSQRLNPSQREQLIGLLSDQLHKCWQVPIAAQSSDKPPVPSIRVKLNQDGTLAADPVVMNTSGDQLFRTVADSATRATRRCAPLHIPPQFQPFYSDWRDLVVNFDPRALG